MRNRINRMKTLSMPEQVPSAKLIFNGLAVVTVLTLNSYDYSSKYSWKNQCDYLYFAVRYDIFYR
jgi:hypothetical protein